MVPRGDHFIQVNWDLLPVLIKNIKLLKMNVKHSQDPCFMTTFKEQNFQNHVKARKP